MSFPKPILLILVGVVLVHGQGGGGGQGGFYGGSGGPGQNGGGRGGQILDMNQGQGRSMQGGDFGMAGLSPSMNERSGDNQQGGPQQSLSQGPPGGVPVVFVSSQPDNTNSGPGNQPVSQQGPGILVVGTSGPSGGPSGIGAGGRSYGGSASSGNGMWGAPGDMSGRGSGMYVGIQQGGFGRGGQQNSLYGGDNSYYGGYGTSGTGGLAGNYGYGMNGGGGRNEGGGNSWMGMGGSQGAGGGGMRGGMWQ